MSEEQGRVGEDDEVDEGQLTGEKVLAAESECASRADGEYGGGCMPRRSREERAAS
jgi:hypothetical protein